MIYGFEMCPAKSGTDTFWIARSTQLEECIVYGDTLDDALNELASSELKWINNAIENNVTIPEVKLLDISEG